VIDRIAEVAREEIRNYLVETKEKSEKEGLEPGEITVEVKPRLGYRPVIHRNSDLVRVAFDGIQDALSEHQLHPESDKPFMAGEDFSFYLERFRGREIPGVFVLVGSSNIEVGIDPHTVKAHSSSFRIDQGVLAELSAIYGSFALRAIEHFDASHAARTNESI